ncbi:MAG TPA: pyridoxamine 5'-phosphate oxidase [Microscillaceae bacterium]|nr:pyridoxamine 5'-phosphate oxidase [Microscillaceae bacterium]
MIKNFTDIAFTESVKQVQDAQGSRQRMERMEEIEYTELYHREKDFIESLDMFYMATTNEEGWPYVQFRGGPRGFLKVLSGKQLGYADFRGNMQYLSVGNLSANNKVALILMDYLRKMRLKIWAETEIVAAEDHPELAEQLILPDYKAKVERLILFNVKAYDWNCPQHITQRFSIEEMTNLLLNGTLKLGKDLLKTLNAMEEE